MPNLARIGLGVWLQEPLEFPTSAFFVWLYIVLYADHSEIWKRFFVVRLDLVFQYLAKRIAVKNFSEMTCFVSGGT